MNRWGPRMLVLLSATVLSMGCSGVDEGSDTPTTTLSFATTTTHQITLGDLVGDWDNGQLFLQVTDDGSYQVLETAASNPNDPLMGGFVAREEANLIFVTNIYGECAGQTGVYAAAMDDTQLVLILVDDPCQFRATRFESPWDQV